MRKLGRYVSVVESLDLLIDLCAGARTNKAVPTLVRLEKILSAVTEMALAKATTPAGASKIHLRWRICNDGRPVAAYAAPNCLIRLVHVALIQIEVPMLGVGFSLSGPLA